MRGAMYERMKKYERIAEAEFRKVLAYGSRTTPAR